MGIPLGAVQVSNLKFGYTMLYSNAQPPGRSGPDEVGQRLAQCFSGPKLTGLPCTEIHSGQSGAQYVGTSSCNRIR